MSVVLNFSSFPEGRDEEFKDVETELCEVGKLDTMTDSLEFRPPFK